MSERVSQWRDWRITAGGLWGGCGVEGDKGHAAAQDGQQSAAVSKTSQRMKTLMQEDARKDSGPIECQARPGDLLDI